VLVPPPLDDEDELEEASDFKLDDAEEALERIDVLAPPPPCDILRSRLGISSVEETRGEGYEFEFDDRF